MPPTSCGARTAFGCSRWTTSWGWVFSRIEHWNAECVGLHVCKRGDRHADPSADLHGACEAVCLDLRRCGAGGWPCGWITAPSICRTTSPEPRPSSEGIQVLRPFEQPQTNGAPSGSIARQGTDHPWPHLPQHRGAAERVRRTTPVDRGEERLPEPRWKLVRRGTPRCHSGPPHETNLCPRNRVRYMPSYLPTDNQPIGCRTSRTYAFQQFHLHDQLPDPLHGDVQFRLHRIALAFLERGIDPGDRLLTPLLEPENLHAQLPRQKFHRLGKSRRATHACASPSTDWPSPSGPAGETWPGENVDEPRPSFTQAHQQQLSISKFVNVPVLAWTLAIKPILCLVKFGSRLTFCSASPSI